MAVNAKGQWDEKYLREQPFMAFGSFMNAFGRINQGKEISLEALIIAGDALFKKAEDYTIKTFNSIHSEDKMGLPKKKF